ncbi:EamA-like transporter family [Seminavis robusta]|uniref:EamA-like transporter family n=1 Tax=Seminavis robusta TaxID=568900 RepID=A0A9N8ED41_9STRA|nr:EamA-like transporter family [Seminavis robusta]|eukprot:Sro825_g207690.1 EamA-like transporter family (509) ;mRNA; r:30691-32327
MGRYNCTTLIALVVAPLLLLNECAFAFGPAASSRPRTQRPLSISVIAGSGGFVRKPAASSRPRTQRPLSLSVFAGSGGFGEPSESLAPRDTSLSSTVEADDYLVVTAAHSRQNTGYRLFSDDDSSESFAKFDLSESIVGNGMSLEKPSLNFARFLVLAASAVYGTNFAVVKVIDEQIPFAVSAVLRFGLAAAVVTAMVLQGEGKQNLKASVTEIEERLPATLAGMEIGGWYCMGYLAQAIGLQTADASKSAFFNALAVIVVPLLDSFLGGKRMGAKGLSSVALAILGVGILQLGPSFLTGTPMSFSQGDAFCLAQAAMFGVGYWRLEQISSQYPTQAGRITVGQLVGVAMGATIFCGVTEDIPATLQQMPDWMSDGLLVGGLAWTALVSTALALYLETIALKTVSAAELTVLMTSVSLFGSAFAYVTMGETMTPIGMVGGLFILGGCIFSSVGGSEAAVEEINQDGLLDYASTSLPPSSIDEEGTSSGQVEVPTRFAFANATAGGLYQ